MSSAASKVQGSVRLGLTLRQVLVEPRRGFASATKVAERRARAGSRRAEGWAPYLLAALGGAAVMSLWLKLAGLAELRHVPAAAFRWPNLIAALVLGGLLGLAAQGLWGRVGPILIDLLHGDSSARDCRIVWGASVLPQTIGLALLLPLDLLVVGPKIYATDNLGDSLATAWAAFSLAVALGLALWSVYLLIRGIETTAQLPPKRAAVGAAGATACFGAPTILFFGALSLMAERLVA